MEQTTKCSQTLRPAFSKQVLRMHSLNSQLGFPSQWHQGSYQCCCFTCEIVSDKYHRHKPKLSARRYWTSKPLKTLA